MKFVGKTAPVVTWMAALCILLLSQSATAQSNNVLLTFYTLTASHAALGAPMQYQLTLTNNNTTSTQVESKVDLIAPDKTTCNLLDTKPTLNPGQVLGTPGTFVTTSCSSLTGTYSLRGYTKDIVTGQIVMKSTIALTVTAAPANGTYGSIGGRGPDTAVIGYTYDFSTVVADLGAAMQSLQTQVILTLPDGTTQTIKPGALSSYNAGAYIITPIEVTTTQLPGGTKTGTYTITINVLDSGSNILSSDVHSFTRTGFPSGFFSPKFKDIAANTTLNTPRSAPILPPNCGSGVSDFNLGNSGAAIADFDQDGYEDILVTGEAGDTHLWKNNHGNGTFTDVASTSGIPLTSAVSASGASFADIDNDGYPDLLLLGGPQGQLTLLHNNKNGTFTDITAGAGLTEANPQNNFSATWGDYDGDGYLDLYVAVHADCSGAHTADHLFHNNGNLTFTEVTQYLNPSKVTARGLTAVFFDYNQDGRPDLYVGNDQGANYGANVLYRNDGPDGNGGWIFTDVSGSSNAGVAIASMGIGIGDFNRDGQFDIYLTNFAASPNIASNVILQGSSAGTFSQVQGDQQGGVHAKRSTVPVIGGGQAASVTWGTGFYDFNNDGWEDIYMAGSGAGCPPAGCLPVNNTVLVNLKGQFLDLGCLASVCGTATGGSSFGGVTPTAVFLDYNKDGFMDVFQAPGTAQGLQSGNLHLFSNTPGANNNHWLQVQLVGTVSNRDAVGARLVASVAGATLLRTVINGATYQGNSTLVQQFGLGTATQVDSLTIYWPSGMTQTFTNIPSNQRMTITEP
jgi:hypothetical protein